MKRIITMLAVLAVSAAFVQAADEKKPEAGKKKDPEEMWKKVNPSNKESLTKEEFSSAMKDKEKAGALFDRKDANKDGKLTKDEFLAKGKKAK